MSCSKCAHIFRARRPFATIIGAAAAAVALAAGISLSPASTPEATAAPGTVVTFGDSFYANPEQIHSTLRSPPATSPTDRPLSWRPE